jgi:hypothetical protein
MTLATRRHSGRILIVLMGALWMSACGLDIREQETTGGKVVDVRTPLGAMSVETDVEVPETGLPLYPGARVRRNADDPGSANVTIGLPFVDVRVVAANYEHDAAPDAILAFYRKAMSIYGEVTECRGEIDFRGRMGTTRPVCDEGRSRRETQLVVGTEERHRGTGSEFSVVYIQTSGDR